MNTTTISIDDSVERCCAALKNFGTTEDNARITAEALVRAESDGQPPNLGQVILAIDARSLSAGNFAERIRDLATLYETLEGARFPGLKRLENRRKAINHGLRIPEPLMTEINQLAKM